MRIAVFEPRFLTSKPDASTDIVLLQNQVKSFAKLGNEVVVLAESDMHVPVETKENYLIYSLRGKLTAFGPLFSPTRRKEHSDFFSPDIILKAVKILKGLGVDVIYTCGSSFSAVFSAIIGHLTNVPTVHYVSDHTISYRGWRGICAMEGYKIPLKNIIRHYVKNMIRELPRQNVLARYGLRHITRIVASSNYVVSGLYDSGLSTEDIPVVYPGVDIPPLVSNFEKLDIPLITYFGHFWQGRGVLDLTIAFSHIIKQHPKAKLMLATTYTHETTEYHFEKLVDKYGLSSNIIRRGVVNNVYLSVLSPSRVIILPYRDVPSIKLIESMAAAKPVVTTRVGWAPELISDGISGFLVNVGDIKGFANKVNMLLDNVELAKEAGKNAREVAKAKCSLDRNTRVILNILRQAKYEGV